IVGKREDFLCNAVIERPRISVLKISSPATINEERVPRQNSITHDVRHVVVRMTRSMHGKQRNVAHSKEDTVLYFDVRTRETVHGRPSDLAPNFALEQLSGSDVVGVDLGLHCHHKTQIERLDHFEVSLPSGKYRIHQDGLARFLTADKI